MHPSSRNDVRGVFLSHNYRDKVLVRPLARQLQLVGAEVLFDEWDVKPGDSIPRWISEGIGSVDVVALFWSRNAAESQWVQVELDAAVSRLVEESTRLVPIRLDDAPLPHLLRPLRYLRLEEEGDVPEVVRELMGFRGDAERLKAMQQALDESGFEYKEFPGYGVLVACPRCGAPASELEHWTETDYARDDQYAGARCKGCGWNDGGEI